MPPKKLIALAATLGLAAAPASALAGPASACTPSSVTKAFAGVDGDRSDYSLAPGGSFEPGTPAWTTVGAARTVAGNENLGVAAGKTALRLPVGSSAISPKFCVDETKPHFRFVYRVDSVGFTGFVASVTYESALGLKSTEFFSSQNAQLAPSKWQASPNSPLATLLPLAGGAATVQIRITAITVAGKNVVTQTMAGGFALAASPMANLGVTVDSVMVDPFRRS